MLTKAHSPAPLKAGRVCPHEIFAASDKSKGSHPTAVEGSL